MRRAASSRQIRSAGSSGYGSRPPGPILPSMARNKNSQDTLPYRIDRVRRTYYAASRRICRGISSGSSVDSLATRGTRQALRRRSADPGCAFRNRWANGILRRPLPPKAPDLRGHGAGSLRAPISSCKSMNEYSCLQLSLALQWVAIWRRFTLSIGDLRPTA